MIEEALVVGLSAWRLAALLVLEEGPFDVFERLRNFIIKPGPIEGFFPKVFSCVWCMSVWTALISYALLLVEPIIVILLAAAAIAVIVQRLTERTIE